MTEIQLNDTKEKILKAARELFALKGLKGASVREIASLAEVNIASLNYHFSSKEKLFLQVIEEIYIETASMISAQRVKEPEESAEDFAVWIFSHFISRPGDMRTFFKMILSEKGWEADIVCEESDDKFGPPGGIALAEAISTDLKKEISEADMFWAVRMIFSNIVHLSLMYSNHFCKLADEHPHQHDLETLKNDIRRLVRIILKDI